MLSKLIIENVALIDKAEISFDKGLNILSGETGAGKSVILDSVNFVLGAKADRTMIRTGESECRVKAEFIVPKDSQAIKILQDMDIDSEEDIIISRRFNDSGKNSIKINGNTVTASMLREVTDTLVDVHGQSEHFYLLKEVNQLKLLDKVCGKELSSDKEKLEAYLLDLDKINKQISLLGGDEKERNRRLEILKFQIDEIKDANLKENEEEELIITKNKINNLEKIINAIKEALNILSGEDRATDCLNLAKRYISNISHLDEQYNKIYEKLDEIAIDTEDIVEQLNDIGNNSYFDEDEAEQIENRLDEIKSLKRKYGASKKEIDEYYERCLEEYKLLSDCDSQYIELSNKKEKVQKDIFTVCKKITDTRKNHGSKFAQRVMSELKSLNIKNAKFEIEFKPYSFEDIDKVSKNGLDFICFMFSANIGEPLKPLDKIISGGEMSRFMLAIKTQLSDINEIGTYIFDEIDTGISGKTAKVVGEKFAQIAVNTQIIAVSHLAQIAAMSDSEYLIEKYEDNEKSHTKVKKITKTEQVKEIARLLGGDEKDEYAYKHAEELIRQAKEYKKTI